MSIFLLNLHYFLKSLLNIVRLLHPCDSISSYLFSFPFYAILLLTFQETSNIPLVILSLEVYLILEAFIDRVLFGLYDLAIH